ncbi:MAG: DEAD/DEAH box helicase, partial [Clostridia bacterium]
EKYSAASLLAESAKRVVGLSGTPIYNRGAEIWNVINILDFHFLGDYESFTREWCYGYGNQIVAKPELLGERLRQEGIMLRRTKQDVLKDLPPKRRLVMAIDSDDAVYRRMMQPIAQKLHLLKSEPEASASQRALWEMEVERGERQATGIAKAPYVAQFVRALLEAEEKVLLFAHHHEVMDIYQRELHAFSPAFVTGRETPAMKERAVERFMAGRTNLCCISLRAASGLNLQRASCVVFGELDWSPAVHSQAEDRAHRMGQTDSILCYYLVSAGGSDQDMQDALGLKVSQFVSLMGDTPQSQAEALEGMQVAHQYVERLVNRLVSHAG